MAQCGSYIYLPTEKLPITKTMLYQPPLDEVAKVLQDELAKHFLEVSISSTMCPDLSLLPFNLASKGLGGQCTLLDVGSASYLTPKAQCDKLYDLRDIAQTIGMDPAFMIGAGLGPWPYIGGNCEMIANIKISQNCVQNQSQIAYIVQGNCKLDPLPNSETRCAILANVFCSKGEQSQVLQVQCKARIGNEDIITYMRKAISNHYKDKIIGLGGVFQLNGSCAKQHIMPDFSTVPLNTPESVQNWIKFYNQNPPLTAVGTLVSADLGMDLKVQHFHGITASGEGGHFYSDTQQSLAEYNGYFALGEILYKIDQPS